jgi:hypothetical protein
MPRLRSRPVFQWTMIRAPPTRVPPKSRSCRSIRMDCGSAGSSSMTRGEIRSISAGRSSRGQAVERKEDGRRVERGDERLGGLWAANLRHHTHDQAAAACPGPLVDVAGARALQMHGHLGAPDIHQLDRGSRPMRSAMAFNASAARTGRQAWAGAVLGACPSGRNAPRSIVDGEGSAIMAPEAMGGA